MRQFQNINQLLVKRADEFILKLNSATVCVCVIVIFEPAQLK